MGIKTVPHRPYSPDLAPCDFWLFPKLKENLRGCWYETIEEMKEAVTNVIDTLTQHDFNGADLPKIVGTVQQVHCSRRRLLRKGLEFHVCTINKSAHTKKVWKFLSAPCTYKGHITFPIYRPLTTAQDRTKSTREPINYERFIKQYPPDIRKLMRRLQRINKKLCRLRMFILFNQIYICIYIYIYRHS